jgi:hypothetical protein
VKKIAFLLILVVVVGGAAVAQDTDHRAFGLELGLIGGYDIGAEAPLMGRTFSFVIPVNDSLQFGMNAIDATVATTTANNYILMTAQYFFTSDLGVQLLTGQGPTQIGAGLNVFFNILKSTEEDALSSTLRTQLGYLVDTSDGLENGSITLGFIATLGI